MDPLALQKRIEDLLSRRPAIGSLTSMGSELLSGTLSIMEAVYGRDSPQARALNGVAEEARKKSTGAAALEANSQTIISVAHGALRNLKAEFELGLLGSLEKRFAGDVLTDLVQLARAVLDQPGDNAKNVAAVLAAAAFEDTIRRMGSTLAGVIGKDDLQDVINALKEKGILVSPQLGIALSFLNFRNRALHANWNEIDRAAVNSVLGFVQELLLKHFH